MSGMMAYFTRRILLVPFTFVAITLMVYAVLRVVPGGPVEQAEMVMKMSAMQGEAGAAGGGDITDTGDMQLDEESLKALQRYYSLDRPVVIGYMQWLGLYPREKRTRIQAVTIQRHPGIFGPLQALNEIKQNELTQFENLLEQHGLVHAGNDYYREMTQHDHSDTPVPEDIRARVETMRLDGFRGRDRHLAWLMERGFTARGQTLYRKIDRDTQVQISGIIEQADSLLRTVSFIDYKLDYIRKIYGFEIEKTGSIYRIEHHFSGILQLDFGRSYTHGRPVIQLIVSKMEVSIQFGLIGYFLSWIVCVPLGVFKALKHRSIFDTGTSFLVFLGYAMPGFVVCLVLLSTVAVRVDWLPLGGYKPDNIDELSFLAAIIGRIRHMLIPVIGYMVGGFATKTILMKNSLLDNLGADYVRTGFAKGLSEKRVVFVHALRNSLIPITAGIGHAIGLLFAGSFLIEKTCNIDGIGLMGYEAVLQRDYPIIMATLVIGVVIRLFGNIISDVVWAMIDPRIRFG